MTYWHSVFLALCATLTLASAPTKRAQADVYQIDEPPPAHAEREDGAAASGGIGAVDEFTEVFTLDTAARDRTKGIYGLNISHYDPQCFNDATRKEDCTCRNLDYKHLTENVKFVWIKASDGTSKTFRSGYVDAKFEDHWKAVRAARPGIYIGAYHFLRPDASTDGGPNRPAEESANEQAQLFLDQYKKINSNDKPRMPIVVDFEDSHIICKRGTHCDDDWDLRDAESSLKILTTWLERVERETGVRPMIYTRKNWLEQHQPTATAMLSGKYKYWLSQYPLRQQNWNAMFSAKPYRMPSLPKGATYGGTGGQYADKHIWQFSESAAVNPPAASCGTGRLYVDMNWFPGDEASFEQQFGR